ncbi:MAG: type protein arginine methyltransferase [Thermoanaerobaculia bacterium]|jgi:protein arginine N-methyltransferase 1|nr:type protein arginine methyltransferase [Thermoanaerobaculia bacterium]
MLEVHRELLLDEIRLNAYRDAIRKVVTPESVVLDIGTGSGILAFFACEAGARRVFAVENQHSADLAIFLTKSLGLRDRMTVLHDHSTKVKLPELADTLVTETLGAFGFEEHILSSVIDARRRLLRPGAAIIPQRVELYVVPVEVPQLFDRHIAWWQQKPYGFDLSPLATFASNVIYVSNIETTAFLADPDRVIACDLATIESADVSGEVEFAAARSGTLHGFAGWFRATLAEGVALSNELPGTRWSHAFLPLEVPQPIEAGDPITLKVETSDGNAWRWSGCVGRVPFDQTTWLATPPCFGAP